MSTLTLLTLSGNLPNINLMIPDVQSENPQTTTSSVPPSSSSQKPPWPFWAVAIISYIFGPTAGFLIAWKNFQKLKQTDFNRRYYFKIGGFFLASFFLLFILSLINVVPKNRLSEISGYFFFPYWISLFGGFFSVIVGLLFYLTFTVLFNLPLLKQKLRNEQKCSASIILYGLLGLIMSILFMYPFSMIISIIPEKTKPQTTIAIPALTSPIPTATQMPTPTPPPYYIKILDNNFVWDTDIKEYLYNDVLQRGLDCWPKIFDPKLIYEKDGESKYTENNKEYSIKALNYIALNAPFKANFYQIISDCLYEDNPQYVVEITKNNKRQSLFSVVQDFSLSPNRKMLFLINFTNTNGKWEQKRRIINLETKQETALPDMQCSSYTGTWKSENLFTYSKPINYTEPAKICIWNKEGEFTRQFDLHLDLVVADGYYLNTKFGLLPEDKKVFYSLIADYKNNDKDFRCLLGFQDIDNQKRNKAFVIEKRTGDVCLWTIEFDFKNINFNSQSIKYRFLEGREKETWSPWKEAKSETNAAKPESSSKQNLKTAIIPFNQYRITLPSGYGWSEIENDVYYTQAPAPPKCEHLINNIPSCHYVRIAEIVDKSDYPPEIIIADHFDVTITSGVVGVVEKIEKLGQGKYLTDYSVYWSGDPENPSQVVTEGDLASFQFLQGCPKDDLCISFSNNDWGFDKIKKFINELIIIEK